MKLNFFFHRLAIDKNDSIGEEFTEFFPLAELVSYGKSLEHVKKILQLEQSGKTFYEILCELKPEYKTRSKKEVERKISQFSYKSIIKYIVEVTNHDDNFYKTLVKIIPDYSELSSFVHGGANALTWTTSIWTQKKVEIESAQLAHSTFNLFVVGKGLMLMICALVEPKFLKLQEETFTLWRQLGDKLEQELEEVQKKL